MDASPPFRLWIEAEEWAPGEWDPTDDVTDAVVTLADGSRWVASFCTFSHLQALRANCAESGECLGGKYLWASDLILVDDTSRPSLEAVVRDLIEQDELRGAFSPADVDGDGDGTAVEPPDDAPVDGPQANGAGKGSHVREGGGSA